MDTGEMIDRIERAARLLSGNAWADLRVTRTEKTGDVLGEHAKIYTINAALITNGQAVPRGEFSASVNVLGRRAPRPTFAELVAELHGVVMAEVERHRDGAAALLGSGGAA